MVLGDAIALRREIVDVIHRWQCDTCCNLICGPTLIDAAHCLIPHELNRIAIARGLFTNVVFSSERRAMCCNQILRCPLDDVVDSRNQNARIAILLTTNCKHVEEHWPHRVVNTGADFREVKVHRVVRVTWRVHCLYLQASDSERITCAKQMGRIDIAGRVWHMCGVLIEVSKTNVDGGVGTFKWHHDGKLFYQPARVGRRNFTECARLVALYFFVCINRQW
ncbi:unannotated protein [freshwater metagenome]|uniref:Unannotated protein n=1 Tax=freshwater metagenome TaxID=449393 RepID=A0A6J6HSV1_9ZZZZ